MDDERQPYPETDHPEDEGIPEMEGPPPQQQGTSDAPEGMVLPRDVARAADDFGTTAAEQREGEPLDERLREEEPDRAAGEGRDQAGRLLDDGGDDTEKDLVADEAEEDTAGLTAEESAMRVQDGAPGAVDAPDDYVEGRE